MTALRLVITTGDRVQAGATRAMELRDLLEASGHVATVEPGRLRPERTTSRCDGLITVSPSLSDVIAAGRRSRSGSFWIVDLPGEGRTLSASREGKALRRGILFADAVTCSSEAERGLIYRDIGASPAVVPPGDSTTLERLLGGLGPELAADRLRILMLGPVNSPHMEDLALEFKHRGHAVRVGGAHWGGGLPPSSLPDAGIPLSTMTRPRPLWFRRVLRRVRPDVVHANWLPFAGAAALAGASPLVAMAWGSDVFHPGPADRLLNLAAVRRAGQVLADSQALLDRLLEMGADPARASVINWGVDMELFRPPGSPGERSALQRSLGLKAAPTVISARGSGPVYNPSVVLDAFARVIEEVPNAQLVLKHGAGEAPDLGPLEGSDQVRLVGRVPYERMADLFRAADVFLSVPTTDSSPRSVWEAMACGCTCVISDLPWVHELIRPGIEALVVPIEAARIADSLCDALTSAALRERVASAARDLVVEHRDRRREMDRLEQLYATVVARGAAPPASGTERRASATP